MRTTRNLPALAAWLCFVLRCASSAAQDQGFALNRYDPADQGSDWFASESLDLRGHQRFGGGLIFDYTHKPLVLYDANGDELAAIVSHQFFGHLGGAVILWDRVRLALNLPIALSQDGESATANGSVYQSDNATTLGDLRLTADARIVGDYREPLTIAAGLVVYAPSGSRDSFTGDGAPRFGVRALAAGQISQFVYAGGLAIQIRPQHDHFADAPRGSEVGFSAAAGLSLLDDRVVVGPEIFGATVISNADGFFDRRTTPLELILGGHFRVSDEWSLGAGVGPGLARGLGTPQWRALLSLTRFEAPAAPQPPTPFAETPRAPADRDQSLAPPDRDQDGIVDSVDACPAQPGPTSVDAKTNGCPPPPSTGAR